jgi:hypothetical protein
MDLLTRRQLERLAKLPKDHAVVGVRKGSPIVERPDGQLLHVQPNGRLAATTLVQKAQSYLDMERC